MGGTVIFRLDRGRVQGVSCRQPHLLLKPRVALQFLSCCPFLGKPAKHPPHESQKAVCLVLWDALGHLALQTPGVRDQVVAYEMS